MSGSPRVLFPLAIDPEALLRFNDPDHKQTHVAAEKLVRAHGILTYGPGDEQALMSAIGELVGRPHRLWAAVVEQLGKNRRTDRQRSTSLAEFLAGPAALDDSAELVRLALVGTGAGGQSKQSVRRNMTERITLASIDEANAMTRSRRIGTFPVGTPRQQINEQLLEPLARRSRLVRIMDPQMFESYLSNPKSFPANVEWLLQVLGEALPPHATISLVGTLQKTWHARDRARHESLVDVLLQRVLKNRRTPLTVTVRLVQTVPRPLKNRFLWFDCTDPFDVLHNFAPLEAEPLKEEFRVSRQEEINFAETARLADEYESANQPGMVSVTKQFP